MLTAIILERVFSLKLNGKKIPLADPSPEWPVEQVMSFYSGRYPILTTSKVEGPEIKNDQYHFTFNSTLGTKG